MSRRRFRIGEHSAYDQTFDKLRLASPLLNPARYDVSWAALKLADKAGLKSLLIELVGRPEKGRYFDPSFGGSLRDSRVLRAQKVVEGIETEFKRRKQEAQSQGRTVPEEMPADLKEKLLQAEARLDTSMEEVDLVQKLLDEIEAREREEADALLLRYGPRGAGRLSGGVLAEIDGQRVGLNEDGEPQIQDERSPFNLMLVRHYREHLVLPFLRSRSGRSRTVRKENLPPWPAAVPKAKESNGGTPLDEKTKRTVIRKERKAKAGASA